MINITLIRLTLLRYTDTLYNTSQGIDILSLSMLGTDLFSCSANGQIQQWSASFDCIATWKAHSGIVLSSVVTYCASGDTWKLITGANDNCIKVRVGMHSHLFILDECELFDYVLT